ncbi:hypothetical protein H072_6652 [Dactylellina haptotyla CBS 200.50]|uniref:Uncharacterized protein n=1 Tax=Dactylellina haptotyla (strain CBS 200.50) TaxID=1284197 RepID=S8A932_DACHA|nr:hypothetical protein H072_6652 [Dactylellina haptotyla CBS 200.50]
MDPTLSIYQALTLAPPPAAIHMARPTSPLPDRDSAANSAPAPNSPTTNSQNEASSSSSNTNTTTDRNSARERTPSPTALSCYIARQIFYADAITVQTVFVDNCEEDVLDELVFRIFSTTLLSHLLNKIERYRGLSAGSCVFYHHGRVVSRGAHVPSGMYFHCCRTLIIKLDGHVRGGACTGNMKRFLKAQDFRKGMFY